MWPWAQPSLCFMWSSDVHVLSTYCIQTLGLGLGIPKWKMPCDSADPKGCEREVLGEHGEDICGRSVPRREAGNCLRLSRMGQVTSQASVGLAKGQEVLSSLWGLTGLFPLGKWADAGVWITASSEKEK